MAKLAQRLQDAAHSGVYQAGAIDLVADAARAARLELAHIALRDVDEKAPLLRVIGEALAFPDWFGENWDALEDCLTDLSWREAKGHVLAFENFQGLSADDLGVLIDVLGSAADFWRELGKPFFAVFIAPGRALELPDLAAGP